MTNTTFSAAKTAREPCDLGKKENKHKEVSGFLITPIAKTYKKNGPCSKIDWEEQIRRGSEFQQMMWDDSTYNKSKVGDVLIFWHHEKGVTFHNIMEIHPPSERLSSWSNNVGQGDRNVIYISNEFYRMNWEQWTDIGGHSRCMGTAPVKTIASLIRGMKNFHP
jgi:hypothetical protein